MIITMTITVMMTWSCLVVLVGEMKICASCAVAVEVERFHLQSTWILVWSWYWYHAVIIVCLIVLMIMLLIILPCQWTPCSIGGILPGDSSGRSREFGKPEVSNTFEKYALQLYLSDCHFRILTHRVTFGACDIICRNWHNKPYDWPHGRPHHKPNGWPQASTMNDPKTGLMAIPMTHPELQNVFQFTWTKTVKPDFTPRKARKSRHF